MKHYLYVSDTKLDMMAAQVPTKLRDRIAADLKLDLKLISVTLRENPDEETRYSKLALVVKHLADSDQLGTLEAPSAYFKGTMTMTWGALAIPDDPDPSPDLDTVFFVGIADESTLVALTGSLRHVIGAVSFPPDARNRMHAQSTLPGLITRLHGYKTWPDQDPGPFAIGDLQMFLTPRGWFLPRNASSSSHGG